jgi:hypothetical protein
VLYQKHFQAAGASDHDETQKVFSHRIPTELSFSTKRCHSVLIHNERGAEFVCCSETLFCLQTPLSPAVCCDYLQRRLFNVPVRLPPLLSHGVGKEGLGYHLSLFYAVQNLFTS